MRILSAALDVGYAEYIGMVMYTDDDVLLMIRPLVARSSGDIARTTCSEPQKLTSNARRYSVMFAASITPSCGAYPALLIKRSSVPPVCSPTVLAAATTCSGSVTSHGTARTFGIPNQRARSGGLLRYPANTCQPSRCIRTTSASPIPVAAPVTKADFLIPVFTIPILRARGRRRYPPP